MKKRFLTALFGAVYLGQSVLTVMTPVNAMAAQESAEVSAEEMAEAAAQEQTEVAAQEQTEEAAQEQRDTSAEESGVTEEASESLTVEAEYFEEAAGEETVAVSGLEEAGTADAEDTADQDAGEAAEEINEAQVDESIDEENDDVAEEVTEEEADAVDGCIEFTFDKSSVSANGVEGQVITRDEQTGRTCVTINAGGEYAVTGNGENVYLSVETTDLVSITLKDLTVENPEDCDVSFIEAAKKTKLTLNLEGENTIEGGCGAVSQKKNSTLNITGDGNLVIKEATDDGIKSKGDITVDTCSIVIDRCGGDGIQGENITINSGSVDITTYYAAASTGFYTRGTASVEGYNTIWESGSTKTERVNVDTGSHKGIKAGTKAKTITFSEGDDEGLYSAEESSTASGSLTINGGSVTIDTTASGLKANSITSGGYTAASTGVYIIGSPDDGLASNNELTINGGNIKIAASDDGISSMGDLTIKGDASVDVITAYEGLEGAAITIGEDGTEGPEISVNSRDDGVNTSSKTLTYVYDSYTGYEADEDTGYYKKSVSASSGANCVINSGKLTIQIDSENAHSVNLTDGGSSKTVTYKAGGDGIDCNGSLDIEGGVIYVFGQSSGDNSPIDTNTGFTLGSKATVLGTGTDGMNESKPASGDGVYVTYGSSQGMGGRMGFGSGNAGSASIAAGSAFILSNGTDEIINTTLPYSASFLIFASPELTSGSNYTMTTGSTVTTATAMAAGSQTQGGGGQSSGNGNNPPTPPSGDEGDNQPTPPSGDEGDNQPTPPSGDEGDNQPTPPSGDEGDNQPTPPTGEGGIPTGNPSEGDQTISGNGTGTENTDSGNTQGTDSVNTQSTDSGNTQSTDSDIIVLPVKDKSLNVADRLKPNGEAAVRYVVSTNAVKVNKKGQVKAKKAGEAVIKSQVKKNGKWEDTGLYCKVKVESPQMTKKKEMSVGESISITELLDGKSTSLTPAGYTTGNSKVAEVSDTGLIKAVSKGSTKISFRLSGVTYRIKITVK